MSHIPVTVTEEPSFLNNVEQEKFDSYSLAKRRKEWLAGRLCLKHSASAYFNEPSYNNKTLKKYVVHNREDGRPFLQGYDEDISISHSKELALAMCSDKPCGVDIQQAVTTLEKVEERYCSNFEATILTQCTAQAKLSQLAMLWACKEAIQKALSCKEKMPGFLELVLEKACAHKEFYIFSLAYTIHGTKRIFEVPVTCFENYAIAYVILEENQCLSSQK